MPPLMIVDSQGISAYGETLSERLWRIQATTGTANEIQMQGADGSTTCRLTNLALPVVNTDAVTKAYVDNIAANLRLKAPVRVLGSADVTLATLAAGSILDGVTLVAGDRVLLIDQTEAVQNGIWVVGAAESTPTRPADYAAGSGACGAYSFVDQGTQWMDRSFACVTDRGVDAVDTNATVWVQFSSRSSALAGLGLVAGATNELDIDTTVVPRLGVSNTFTGLTNTFNGALTTTGLVTAPRITNLTTGSISAPSDAVNVEYLRNRIDGFSYKLPALVASTAPLATLATTLVAGYALDGVTLAAGDRVLIKDQADAAENGLYIVQETDAPVRPADLAAGASAYGAFLVVTSGSTFNDQAFVCTNNTAAASVVGTSAIHFSALVTQSAGLAGAGLVENGRALDVHVDDSTLQINADTVRVKAGGITNNEIAASTIANDRLVNNDVTLTTSTGSGLTSTNSGVVALGSSVTLTVDHTYVPYLGQTNTFTAANTFSGNVTVSTGSILTAPRITGIDNALIAADSDVVNVQYVRESVVQQLNAKSPVRAAAAAAVTLSTLMATSVVDGVTLAAADRVLLTAQTDPIANGIYVIRAADVPLRAADMTATTASVSGSTVVVIEGTVYAGRTFVCTSPAAADTVDTDALTFVAVAHSLGQLAGSALVVNSTAMQLDVAVDNSTIEVSSDALRLKDSGITNAKIANATIANAKLAHDGVVVTTTAGSGLVQAMTDSLGATVTDGDLELGGSVALTVDHTYVPYLGLTNAFTAQNTFGARVRCTAAVAASTDGGAGGTPDASLIVTGGAYVSGDLYCNSTLNFSDERLKADIQVIPDALATICAIDGCTYTWKDDAAGLNRAAERVGEAAVGVIAQQLQRTDAQIAVVKNGEYLAVDYTRLVPFLIESVKSLKRRCDDLDEEIQVLKRARHE